MLEIAAVFLVVLIGAGICSGVEAALFSVSTVKIRSLADSGLSDAKALLRIKEDIARPIMALVIVTNLFTTVGPMVVGAVVEERTDSLGFGILSALMTFLTIVFAEIMPKTLGERHSLPIARAAAHPLLALTWLTTPLILLLERLLKVILGRTGAIEAAAVDENEIKILAMDGRKSGSISESEAEMIQKVFGLKEKSADEMMTPRVSVVGLSADAALGDVREEVLNSPHSRLVVYGEDKDDVLGVVLRNDILRELVAGHASLAVAELSSSVQVVPPNTKALDLLASFRSSRQHLHVVGDEHGGMAGVVTLEDVMEELTGEIMDETDEVADIAAQAKRRSERVERLRQVTDQPGPDQAS
jgi:CBS domain containing-hemolysin-like protein